jgi:hypothetical protein
MHRPYYESEEAPTETSDRSGKADIKKLIVVHNRRLQKLKEQQAKFGPLYAPAHLVMEIEETEAEIKRLQTELETVSEPSSLAISITAQCC